MTDFFALYDALLPEIPQEPILCVSSGDFWTGVETADALGLAMTTTGNTAPRVLPRWEEAATLAELAPAVKSWNFAEASAAMAAINAFYNTRERMENLNAAEPFEHYCTRVWTCGGRPSG